MRVPENFTEEEVLGFLAAQGYRRIHSRSGSLLEVAQDRVVVDRESRSRIVEDLEAALAHGAGRVNVYPADGAEPARRSASPPTCTARTATSTTATRCPNLFSFNSPIGACETCRGFGRTIGIDYGLVVPDPTRTLAEGAIRPWQTESYGECQDDLMSFARRRRSADRRSLARS